MVSDKINTDVTQNVIPKKKLVTPNHIACNDLTVRNTKPTSERVDYWFRDNPGFGLRVTPKGTKSFVHVFRFANKLTRSTLGAYPKMSLREARKKYDEQKEQLANGINPTVKQKKKKSTRITVKEAIDIYEEHGIITEKASVKEEIRALRKDLEPEHGNLWIRNIDSDTFNDILLNVLKRGSPQMANHLHSYLHRMCNVLTPRYLDFNPISSLEKPAKTKQRSRVLTFSEIYTFWYDLPQTSMQTAIQLALKFMLVTVQRGKDIRLMELNEYNVKDEIWTIPDPKNDRPWRVPLNKYAVEIMQTTKFLNPKVNNPFLLNSGELMTKDTLPQSLDKQRKKLDISHFTPHDLRRSAATMITALGGRPHWATLMLNHTDKTVRTIYDQYAYDYEKRISVNLIEFALDKILSCHSVEEIPSIDEMRDLVKKANILQN